MRTRRLREPETDGVDDPPLVADRWFPLGRLGLDRVDIALIHDPDDFMGQAADEAYPALAELRVQDTVRAVAAG